VLLRRAWAAASRWFGPIRDDASFGELSRHLLDQVQIDAFGVDRAGVAQHGFFPRGGSGWKGAGAVENGGVMRGVDAVGDQVKISSERLLHLEEPLRADDHRVGAATKLAVLNADSFDEGGRLREAHPVGRMDESSVIYDITDDWMSLTQAPALIERIRVQDSELCRRADAVIVCSQRLFEMKQPLARNLHLIPNGVDAAHYAAVLHGAGPLPPAAAAWEKPVLGYTGTIHAERVDLNLVEEVARKLTKGSIVLIGPNHLDAAAQARLKSTGRVHFAGAMPYAELPQYMRAFDVCITPHRVTAFTESLNPIKLWEYMAAGKPIVSTDIAGFRDYPSLVRIARDADSFLDAVREALAEDPKTAALRQSQAAGHSWEQRLDAIEAIIADSLQRRETGASGQPANNNERRSLGVPA